MATKVRLLHIHIHFSLHTVLCGSSVFTAVVIGALQATAEKSVSKQYLTRLVADFLCAPVYTIRILTVKTTGV